MQPLDSARTVNMPVVTSAVSVGDPVKRGSNGIEPAGDGDTMFGIAISDGAVGETIAVWRGSGTFKATAATGVNFSVGDQVYLAASGEIDTGATGNKSCGVVVDEDPDTASDNVHVDFDPWGTFTHA